MADSDALEQAELRVALNGYAMQLRPSELESVAAGLGQFDVSEHGDAITLVDALRRLPVNDRAPAWELALRRFGRHKELGRAAADIGMDLVHARDLLEALFGPPGSDPPAATKTPPSPSGGREGPGWVR